MKRLSLILILIGALTFSCRRGVIIPKETMADIYHDMYLLDQSLNKHQRFERIQDSLLVYEPLFNKYGYTFEDYTASVNYYLQRPAKFEKVFTEVKSRFEKRIKYLEDSLAIEGRKSQRWALIDSVRILGPDSSLTTKLYRCLDMMFFKKDTTFLKNYPEPDSTALAAWKLNAFELYIGNPFSDTLSLGRLPFVMPDSTALQKQEKQETQKKQEKNDAVSRELNRKFKKSDSRIRKMNRQ